MNKSIFFFLVSVLSFNLIFSQDFTVNQNASYLGTGGCYELTPDLEGMYGMVWNHNKMDISKPFDIAFSGYFGTNEPGADGICFTLQNTAAGTSAIGIGGSLQGSGGLTPSFSVEFDIFTSGGMNEPVGLNDHISIFRDGNNDHATANYLAGPVDVGNLEDGAYHNFRITWNPATQLITVYNNCVSVLTYTYDITNNVFSGNNNVYWGFTAGCGWFHANQIVCGIESLEDTITICQGDTVALDATFMPTATYVWSPATNIDNVLSMTPNVYPPSSTMYHFTYFDACGVMRYDSTFINVNPLPVVDLGPDTSICAGETLHLDAQNSGCNYIWLPGNENTQTIDVTTANTYSVYITDANSCTYSDNIVLTIDPLPVPLISGNMNLCFGDTTTLTASGGDQYLWSTGDISSSISVNPQLDSIYFVTVTNSVTGCFDITTDTVFSIPIPIPSLTGDFIICLNESTTLVSSGGDLYLWSTGETNDSISVAPVADSIFTVTVTDATTTCHATISDTVFVNPLPYLSLTGDTAICFGDSTQLIVSGADSFIWNTGSVEDSLYVIPSADSLFIVTGTYTSTSCSSSDSIFIVVHDLPVIIITPDTAICEGESILLNSTGGSLYEWSPIASLSDPNISDPTATPEFTTTYTVTVTTVFGCIDSASVTVTINDLPSFSLDGNNVSCNGFADGAVWVESVGINGPYSYLWNNSSTDTLLTGLSGGTYAVTVTNIFGCTQLASFYVIEPTALHDSVFVTDLLCFEDSSGIVELIMTGGTPVYTYAWSNGQSTGTISGLSAGSFDVTITDNNGCKMIIPEINVYQPDPVVVITSQISATCNTFEDGSVSSSVTGGTTPYQYLWSTGDTNPSVSSLGAGNYQVTVTDDHNCSEVEGIEILQPEILQIIDSAVVDAGCFESGDGYICFNNTGGTPPYTILWSDNETANCNTNLFGGTYSLTVTDNNNCVVTETYTITNGTATCLEIPTLFTPNSDGFNDDWDIQGIEYYPVIDIQIFNRWGDVVFSYTGSGAVYNDNPWDGTLNDKKDLPMGSYVYILDIKNEETPFNGVVSIKR